MTYDRRVAARKRREPPTPSAPSAPKTLESLARSVMASAINAALRKVRVLDQLKVVLVSASPSDHFSDGKEIGSDPDSLGYAFTIRYPTKAITSGTFELELQPNELVDELRREVDYALKQEDVPSEPLLAALLQAGTSHLFDAVKLELGKGLGSNKTLDRNDVPDKLLEAIESKAGEHVEQSIEAYSHEGTVKLPEYPDVYLRWGLRFDEMGLKVQGSGFKYHVQVQVTWKIKPDRWAFAEDLYRASGGVVGWYPL